jgi:hypothetical protein
MANQFIELHDSVLAVMWYEGDSEAVLIFSKLYLHQSEGVAGMDAGVGWFQRAELVIEDASLAEFIRAWPCEIYGGEITLDGVTHSNGAPLPLVCKDRFRILLEAIDDENNLRRIEIEGSGAQLTFYGEPGAVENFPGAG